jgi:DNA polymerase-1
VTGPLDNVKLHNVETFDDVREYIDWFSNMDADAGIAVDTETTGFKWHGDDYVRMVQVSNKEHGWAMPWERYSGLFVDTIKKHGDAPIDLMNAKFDYAFLRKAGVTLPQAQIRDVGIMSYVLEPHMSRALKPQSKRHVDPRAGALQWQLDEAIGSRSDWSWATIPCDFELYWQYAALDPVLTAHLSDHHLPIVQSRSPYAYEVENAFQWVALKAETYGVRIDVPYADEHYAKFTAYCNDVERWCEKEYGIKPGSNQAIVRKLVEIGYSEDHYFSARTEKGAIALDAGVLEGIDHPLAKAVLQRRQLQKIASTYLKFYVGHVDSNSLIHPSINTVGALTGRMSVSEPNLQNLPVRGTNPAHKIVRNCVVARPDHTLIMVDFDQVEMRGLAIDSGDAGLIAAFQAEEDFFVTIARQVYNDSTLVKSDPRRQPVKNGMYARIYGAGLVKQAATAGVSVEQMRYVNTSLNERFPGIERYARGVIDEAIRNGHQENSLAFTTCPLTGQRHYAERGKEYALVNYRIQGWAAKLLKIKALELDAAGLGDYIIAFVHDEIIFDVPNELVRDAIQTIMKIMNDDAMFPVAISASVSTGQRWGEKKEWIDES